AAYEPDVFGTAGQVAGQAYYDALAAQRSLAASRQIPLFEGFERTYQVRNALALREASEAELADTEQQVSLE
ncbi:TolC family protein, partial [Pseudomonas aeruginosa]|uniref:TolC family protein n=1 Tax=Pseudomonas aeruginosa TaxID=287 RepID=UPI0033658B89